VAAGVPIIQNDPAQLADFLISVGRGLILLDGRPAAGKTYLAKHMAALVGGQTVDADRFLLGNGEPFLSQLQIAKLKAAIADRFAASPLVLLSTVCALAVVERLGRSAAAVVWVEGVSEATMHIARDYLADDIFAEPADLGRAKRPALRTEVEQYEAAYGARLKADCVYLNAVG